MSGRPRRQGRRRPPAPRERADQAERRIVRRRNGEAENFNGLRRNSARHGDALAPPDAPTGCARRQVGFRARRPGNSTIPSGDRATIESETTQLSPKRSSICVIGGIQHTTRDVDRVDQFPFPGALAIGAMGARHEPPLQSVADPAAPLIVPAMAVVSRTPAGTADARSHGPNVSAHGAPGQLDIGRRILPGGWGAIAASAVADARNIAPAATSVASDRPMISSLRENMVFLLRFARERLLRAVAKSANGAASARRRRAA